MYLYITHTVYLQKRDRKLDRNFSSSLTK